jgi:hypothetical protein
LVKLEDELWTTSKGEAGSPGTDQETLGVLLSVHDL